MKRRPPIPAGPYLVVGLARSGIAAARALRARGEQVDRLDAAAPAGGRGAARARGWRCILEDDDMPGLLERVRAVVKSPGVPAQAPMIVAARERGLDVLGELELAWRLLRERVHRRDGDERQDDDGRADRPHPPRGGAAGRGRGQRRRCAELGSSASSAGARAIVCEASSFQLEDTLAFAPEAAVLLNLTPDHLDRHGTLEAYARGEAAGRSRARTTDDVAVLSRRSSPSACERGGARGARSRARGGACSSAADSSAALFERDGALWWRGRSR